MIDVSTCGHDVTESAALFSVQQYSWLQFQGVTVTD